MTVSFMTFIKRRSGWFATVKSCICVDDYSKGQNVTTWVRVKSNRENHIRLAEYLTKGRLVLVDGTLSASLWEDRNGNSQTQLTITADSIAFIGAGKRDAAGARAEDNAPAPSAAPQDDTDDLPF